MSRPKKVILLYCTCEARRRELSFMLTTRGYGVMAIVSPHPPLPDVAVFVDDMRPDSVDICYMVPPAVPLLVILKPARFGLNYPVHAILLQHSTSMAELLEWVRIAVARKRGPKRQVQQQSELVTA